MLRSKAESRSEFFEKPPSDIDPFAASPAELRKYGLPPVPDHPRHRERYQRLFGQIRHKLTFVEPAFRVNPGRFPLRGREGGILIGAETFASSTTSGTFVVAPPGDSIRWMQGDWVVPNLSAPTQEGEYFCAFWIGIGGTGEPHFRLASISASLVPTDSCFLSGNGFRKAARGKFWI